MFELEALRAFVAVAEYGSFTRAGERLHLTQSAISQQVRRLEDSIGRPLFRRTTRSVELNPDGDVMLFHARRILDCMNTAWHQVTSPLIAPCSLRIGATEDIATMWLQPLLAEFANAYPTVRLDVSVGITKELLDRLEQGETNFVVGKRRAGDDRGEMIGEDSLVWVGCPEVLRPMEKREIRLAVFPSSCVYRACISDALQGSGRQWCIAYTSPSLAGIRAVVGAGLCITALPRAFAVELSLPILDDAGLPRLPGIEFALFGRGGDGSPAEQEFKRLVRRDIRKRYLHRG